MVVRPGLLRETDRIPANGDRARPFKRGLKLLSILPDGNTLLEITRRGAPSLPGCRVGCCCISTVERRTTSPGSAKPGEYAAGFLEKQKQQLTASSDVDGGAAGAGAGGLTSRTK